MFFRLLVLLRAKVAYSFYRTVRAVTEGRDAKIEILHHAGQLIHILAS